MRKVKQNLSLALVLAFTFSNLAAYADVAHLMDSKIDPASVPGVKAEDAQKAHDAKLALVDKLNGTAAMPSAMCAEGSANCADVVLVDPLPIEPAKPPVCPSPNDPVIILTDPIPVTDPVIELKDPIVLTDPIVQTDPIVEPNPIVLTDPIPLPQGTPVLPTDPEKKPEPPVTPSYTVKIPADSAHPYDTFYILDKKQLTLTMVPPGGFGVNKSYMLDKATGQLTLSITYRYDPTKIHPMNIPANIFFVYLPGTQEYAETLAEMTSAAEANADRTHNLRDKIVITTFIAELKHFNKHVEPPVKISIAGDKTHPSLTYVNTQDTLGLYVLESFGEMGLGAKYTEYTIKKATGQLFINGVPVNSFQKGIPSFLLKLASDPYYMQKASPADQAKIKQFITELKKFITPSEPPVIVPIHAVDPIKINKVMDELTPVKVKKTRR